MSKKTIQWGILAAGNIAGTFASALHACDSAELLAVASRDSARAERFARAHKIPRAYGSYEALLTDPDIDAVYIATIHPEHLKWILRAVHAGKHVLCEKPLAMNLREAKQAQHLAKEKRRLLREGFMYRYHPQTQKIAELVAGGAIGRVRMIEAQMCFDAGDQLESRIHAKSLGGGGILDVGCYTLSFARLIAGRARGRLFAEPLELKAVGHLDPRTKVDLWTTASLRFEGDILAQLSCAVRMRREDSALIIGESGQLKVESPWFCRGKIELQKFDGPTEVFDESGTENLYSYEIEAFVGELQGRPIGADAVGMRLDDTLGNMKALDWWRSEIGLGYDADRV